MKLLCVWQLLYKVVLRDNQSSTSKELYLMIQFFTLSAPLRWFFSNSVPIQSELIHSVKSLIEKATTSASSRISNRVAADWEKNACRQILREMVKAQEIRNDFRRSQKRGCGRDDFFPFCKENHRKLHFFPPLSIAPLEVVLLLLQLYCVYQLKSVQLIPGVALRLNDAS